MTPKRPRLTSAKWPPPYFSFQFLLCANYEYFAWMIIILRKTRLWQAIYSSLHWSCAKSPFRIYNLRKLQKDWYLFAQSLYSLRKVNKHFDRSMNVKLLAYSLHAPNDWIDINTAPYEELQINYFTSGALPPETVDYQQHWTAVRWLWNAK